MSSSIEALRTPRNRKPRSVLVIAPKSIIDDELRMLRLEEGLQAEFPDLTIVMAARNSLPGNQSGVGMLADADGSSPFPPEETNRIMAEVSEAMEAFVEHRKRAVN